jgi:alanyl-tRNA synthetase
VGLQAERLKESDNARRRLEKDLAGFRARERYDAATPDANGVRIVIVRDASSMDELRALAQASFALPRVVVAGVLSDPPSVLVASSEDSGVDAGKWLKERLAAAGGRGGGSPRIAQGSVPDRAAADAVLEALTNRV